jgi:plasmid stabilization system protein ParE
MPRLILTPEAIADLQRVRDFLAQRSPEAAAKAQATLVEHLEKVQRFPAIYRPVPHRPDEREAVIAFGSYGYVLRYRHDTAADLVAVLRVWHQREQKTPGG